jgi:hypothetical protein
MDTIVRILKGYEANNVQSTELIKNIMEWDDDKKEILISYFENINNSIIYGDNQQHKINVINGAIINIINSLSIIHDCLKDDVYVTNQTKDVIDKILPINYTSKVVSYLHKAFENIIFLGKLSVKNILASMIKELFPYTFRLYPYICENTNMEIKEYVNMNEFINTIDKTIDKYFSTVDIKTISDMIKLYYKLNNENNSISKWEVENIFKTFRGIIPTSLKDRINEIYKIEDLYKDI